MVQSRNGGARGKPKVAAAGDKVQQLAAYADEPAQVLTTNQGLQIPDNHNSLKAGLRGPTLLEDFILR